MKNLSNALDKKPSIEGASFGDAASDRGQQAQAKVCSEDTSV
jgi:hypothetical protein